MSDGGWWPGEDEGLKDRTDDEITTVHFVCPKSNEGASLMAQMVKNPSEKKKKKKRIHLECRRPRFDPWVRKTPWRRAWQPTPVFLLGELNGQRSLVGYTVHGVAELDTTERLIHTQGQRDTTDELFKERELIRFPP